MCCRLAGAGVITVHDLPGRHQPKLGATGANISGIWLSLLVAAAAGGSAAGVHCRPDDHVWPARQQPDGAHTDPGAVQCGQAGTEEPGERRLPCDGAAQPPRVSAAVGIMGAEVRATFVLPTIK